MKIFINLVVATLKDLARDRMAIFWFILFPILFIFLFGMIFSGGAGNVNFDLGIVVEEQGIFAETFIASLKQSEVFTIYQGSLDAELEALAGRRRNAVLALPQIQLGPQFSSGDQPSEVIVPVYYDASSQANKVPLFMLGEIFNHVERGIQNRPRIFAIDARPVQSEALSDIDYLLPGILAMALMQLGLFGSLRLVYLRERKVLKSLGATPLPRVQIVFSEIVIRLLMAAIQTSLIILIGHFVFDVQIVGSWWQVLATVLFGAFVFVSIGYMLVTFAKTEESGNGIIQVVQFPMMFLSGIFFQLEFLPPFLAPVVKAIPLTYLGDLLRSVLIGMPYAFGLATDLLVLGGWLIISLILTIRFWRWE